MRCKNINLNLNYGNSGASDESSVNRLERSFLIGTIYDQ
jgi:hypothetical protein